MALAFNKENYALHKLHSLTGVVPVGYYMVQHLALNTFTLAGPQYFNNVIHFFEAMPKHLLLGLEIFGIWIPMLFHAVYGLFINSRGLKNNTVPQYAKYRENRYYSFQRWSGIFIFIFLCYHVASTTGVKMYTNSTESIEYAAMAAKFTANGYIMFVFYALGILTSTYHFSYGLWSFCIRWGITVSEKSQARMFKISGGVFVGLLLMGWAALAGFLIHDPKKGIETKTGTSIEAPVEVKKV